MSSSPASAGPERAKAGSPAPPAAALTRARTPTRPKPRTAGPSTRSAPPPGPAPPPGTGPLAAPSPERAARVAGPVRLVTGRLILRPATAADLPGLASVFRSNPEYLRTIGTGLHRFDVADARRYVEAEAGRTNGHCLALVERASGAVVGSAALAAPNPADGIPWIGLLILRADRQGRGLGREAATAIERRLARDGWAEVRLAVLASNPRARRFWERLGYRQVDGCWRAYDGRARAGATLGKALHGRPAAA